MNAHVADFSTHATARWSATIRLVGDRHGGGLNATTSFTHDISESSGFSGDVVHPNFKDSPTLLREQLDEAIIVQNLKSTIHELESAFAGVWPLFYSGAYGYTLSHPIFNSCGDLLFELERPVDRQGRICVPVQTRHDICLPSKSRGTCASPFPVPQPPLITHIQRSPIQSKSKVSFFPVSASFGHQLTARNQNLHLS
jgi:hypothetical protein